MSRQKPLIPPLPDEPVKMLYEYKYSELPPDKKAVMKRFLTVYLDWVISNPKFWEDEEDEKLARSLG